MPNDKASAADLAKTKATEQISALVEKQMDKLGLTQQTVAAEVGFKSRNMLSIIKTGMGKLPIDRVPALAKTLKIDERRLLRLALQQSNSPEIVNAIMGQNDALITANEREILEHIRQTTGDADPELTEERAKRLTEVFS